MAEPVLGPDLGTPRFGALLTAIVLLYILIIAVGRNDAAVPVRVLVLGAALMLAVRLTGPRRWARAALAGAVAAVAVSAVAVAAGGIRLATGLSSAASAFLYFSVVTLATVGFGDIVPASNAARAVVVAEALTGQLYLVSVVAAVVARWTPRSPA